MGSQVIPFPTEKQKRPVLAKAPPKDEWVDVSPDEQDWIDVDSTQTAGERFASSPERTPFYREELERQREPKGFFGTLRKAIEPSAEERRATNVLIPSSLEEAKRNIKGTLKSGGVGAINLAEGVAGLVAPPSTPEESGILETGGAGTGNLALLGKRLFLDPTNQRRELAKRAAETGDRGEVIRQSALGGISGVPILGPWVADVLEGLTGPSLAEMEQGKEYQPATELSEQAGMGAAALVAPKVVKRGIETGGRIIRSGAGLRPTGRFAYKIPKGKNIQEIPEKAETRLGGITKQVGEDVAVLKKKVSDPFQEFESRLPQPIADVANLQGRLLAIQSELNIPQSSMPKLKTLETGEWVVEIPTNNPLNPLFQVEAKPNMNFAELRAFKDEIYRVSRRATPKGKAALSRFADIIENEHIQPAVDKLGTIQLESGKTMPAKEAYTAAKKGYTEFSERMGRDSAMQEFLDAAKDPTKLVSLLRDPSKGKAIKEAITSQPEFNQNVLQEWNAIQSEGLLEPQLPGRPVFGQMTGMSQKEAALTRLEAMADQARLSVPAEARLASFLAGQVMLLTRLPLRFGPIRKWMVKGLSDVKPQAKLTKIAPPEIAPSTSGGGDTIPSPPILSNVGVIRPQAGVMPSTPEEMAASYARDRGRVPPPPPEVAAPPKSEGPSRLEQTRGESIRRTQISQIAAALEKGRTLKGGMTKVAQQIIEKEVGMEAAKAMSDVELASALRSKLKPPTATSVQAPSSAIPKPPRVILGAKETKLPKPKVKPPKAPTSQWGIGDVVGEGKKQKTVRAVRVDKNEIDFYEGEKTKTMQLDLFKKIYGEKK